MSDELLEQEGPELIDLEDEDGNTVTFEFIDAIEYNDNKYYALVPYSEDEEESENEENEEFVILKEQGEGDDTVLVTIDDDDEYSNVGEQFLKRFSELFSEDDGEILQ